MIRWPYKGAKFVSAAPDAADAFLSCTTAVGAGVAAGGSGSFPNWSAMKSYLVMWG